MAEIKELIHYNEAGYNKEIALLNAQKPKFEEIIALYIALGLPPLNNAEYERLFVDTQELVIDKMIAANPAIYPATFKREMAKDFLNMPEGFTALVDKITSYSKGAGVGAWNAVSFSHLSSNFELVDGELEIKESIRAYHEERFKIYATSQKQIDAHAQVLIIANALNATKEAGYYFEPSPDVHASFIERAVKIGGSTHDPDFKVNYEFIARIV